MIRKLACMTLVTGLMGMPAHADTLLGLTADVDSWNMDSSGSLADSSDMQSFDLGSERHSILTLALEHPLPVVPNLKIRTNDLSSSGDQNLAADFDFSDVDFPAGLDVNVDFEVQNTDFIFYYEIFDNDTVSFDLGLNLKYLDGDIEVESSGLRASESFDGYVPMFHGALKVGVPATRLWFFGDLSLLSVGDHTLQDYTAGVAFKLVESLAVDISVKGGYHRISLELEDLDDIYTDWDFDGAFFGLQADF
ncbi:MAG: TIGR04219 family outer membrane beta-barrel protein [Candidatus Thiodiazotropha sp.]|nr:TIGR04219 family outer membrane beta-barrel protein [Candidatus Thiodiazotropha taylori]MBT3059639.1 TIGR04219 family outer membrane beta-barrel protein [Candidatus Thiodiazotropha sp. (ex Lucina pensylvanica)]MBT3063349.1 TIGR04219 family outer membrane beta-barrel protein [Candidatus Thiodiazotropha sp. (ex Lucina pensylvanica)]MBV2096147.1 TIGR04219 family outer membrane beta-barrel protein [Candidatus Thiodiazotropha sp. (ex Codakia orbicularis)]